MLRVTNVVGARPNFIKIAPIMKEMARRSHLFQPRLVHTGQHYDREMSAVFFEELEIPRPHVDLGCGGGTHAEQTAAIMVAFERELLEHPADLVLVVGDVNSTMACALVASKLHVPVAHVEAGLRSGDMTMPEEINRRVTDAIADLLLTPSRDAGENLRREGAAPEKIHFVGNVMIDTLLTRLPKTEGRDTLERFGVAPSRYVTVTLHRPALVDHPGALVPVVDVLVELAEELPLVWPVHPRTRERLVDFGLLDRLTAHPGVHLTDPIGYLDMLTLNRRARFILTDSGGLQQEATMLKVPCITLRPNTEWWVTVTCGANRIIGDDPTAVRAAVDDLIRVGRPHISIPDRWDGRTAGRICDVIANVLPETREDGGR